MKKYLLTILICFMFIGCKYTQYERQFIIAKSDDDNWTTSAVIECDSVDMITEKHAVYWIDGHRFNLKGGLIKIASNPNFKK